MNIYCNNNCYIGYISLFHHKPHHNLHKLSFNIFKW